MHYRFEFVIIFLYLLEIFVIDLWIDLRFLRDFHQILCAKLVGWHTVININHRNFTTNFWDTQNKNKPTPDVLYHWGVGYSPKGSTIALFHTMPWNNAYPLWRDKNLNGPDFNDLFSDHRHDLVLSGRGAAEQNISDKIRSVRSEGQANFHL